MEIVSSLLIEDKSYVIFKQSSQLVWAMLHEILKLCCKMLSLKKLQISQMDIHVQ